MAMNINRFIVQIKQTLETLGVRVTFGTVVRQDVMIVLPPFRQGVVGEEKGAGRGAAADGVGGFLDG